MPTHVQPDPIQGPAKWLAIAILGGAALIGIGSAISNRSPRWAYMPPSGPRTAVAAPSVEAPASHVAVVRPPPPTPPPRLFGGEGIRLTEPGAFAALPAASPAAAPEREPIETGAAAAVAMQPIERAPEPEPTIAKKINLNAATQEELELLPGIGPALASRIIEHRNTRGPFRRLEDLARVSGIGPRTLERIRPHVTVAGR